MQGQGIEQRGRSFSDGGSAWTLPFWNGVGREMVWARTYEMMCVSGGNGEDGISKWYQISGDGDRDGIRGNW